MCSNQLKIMNCFNCRWKEVLRSTTHGSHTQIQLLVQHMPEVAKVLAHSYFNDKAVALCRRLKKPLIFRQIMDLKTRRQTKEQRKNEIHFLCRCGIKKHRALGYDNGKLKLRRKQ